MPKTGTPDVKTPSSMPGAPASYTLEGPPERMIAFGSRASMSATGIVCGTISEYTLASRTRRAMSWAYCAPKSTTRTRSCSVTALSRLGHRDPSGVGVGAPRSLSAALLLPAQTLPCVRFTLTSTRLSAELRQLGGALERPAEGADAVAPVDVHKSFP